MDALKLGLLYPEGGGEYEYFQFAEATDFNIRPYLIVTHLAGGDDNHQPDALRETGSLRRLSFSAERLSYLKPHVALWACTSGSFIVGRKAAEEQAAMISRTCACPSSSTSLAFVAALRALGLKRVGVLASYIEETSRAFVTFLNDFGVEVEGFEWFGAPGGNDAYAIKPELFVEAARRLDSPRVEAFLIPDTAIAGFPMVRAIEAALGKTALSANQVTIWQGLKLAGRKDKFPQFGRLMA